MKAFNIIFCVVGWKFQSELYEQLALCGCKVVCVANRKPPDYMQFFNKDINIVSRSNVGYDWGAYNYFLKNLYDNKSFVIFMHDDIILKNPKNLINKIKKIFRLSPSQLIVNGPNSIQFTNWFEEAPHLTSLFRKGECHLGRGNVFRGSFFACGPSILNDLKNFRFVPDRFRIDPRFGNQGSVYNFCKMTSKQEVSVSFLGDDYCISDYLIEEQRGGEGLSSPRLIKRLVIRTFYAVARRRARRLASNSYTFFHDGLISLISGERIDRA